MKILFRQHQADANGHNICLFTKNTLTGAGINTLFF